jgi:HAD superfamily hydrolase (TIGR01458 family)
MRKIEGLLSDVHGVLYVYPDPVPGSPEAVRALQRSGLPHLFLTNSTQHEKAWILASLREAGFDLKPERLLTAAEAAGSVLAELGHRRIGWLAAPGLAADLPAVEPVPPDRDEPVDAVLVGDMQEGFTHPVLNRGFRWLQEGADLIALARNRFYQTRDGLVLDSGPYVRLLEEAAGVTARVVGKPSPDFFRAGISRLGLPPERLAMVGDDLEADLLPARDLGLTTVQVRTGKYREARYAAAPRKADHLMADAAEAVRWVLGGA